MRESMDILDALRAKRYENSMEYEFNGYEFDDDEDEENIGMYDPTYDSTKEDDEE